MKADSGHLYNDLPKPTMKDKVTLSLIIFGVIMLIFFVLVGIGF